MAEQQACPVCSFQSSLKSILCLGILQRSPAESKRGTQITPATWVALARSYQGFGSRYSHRATSSRPLSTPRGHCALVPYTSHPGDKGSSHVFAMTLLCSQSRPQVLLSSASRPWPRTQCGLTSPAHWKDAINPEWKIPQKTAPGL